MEKRLQVTWYLVMSNLSTSSPYLTVRRDFLLTLLKFLPYFGLKLSQGSMGCGAPCLLPFWIFYVRLMCH